MSGKVFLIGAGPGDPELMTLKAARALGIAEVVLIDDLVSRGCLAHARSHAKVIEVGKRGGCKNTPQEFIERLLVQYARQGKIVARLKGGDPFVFGRGGEELEVLRAARIEVEVIPGITAGTAVPATPGHTKDGAEPDWPALARTGLTLVIYMGIARLPQIAAALLQAGMSPYTPACAIENGTLRNQRQVITRLSTLAPSAARLSSPAIIVIGDVVRFAQEFGVGTRINCGPDPEFLAA